MDSVSVALRAVAVQRWLSIAAVLSAFVLPILSLWILTRWSAGRRAWQASLIWLGGSVGTLAYVAAALIFGFCAGGQVGEFGKERLARAYGAPVVQALEAFHRDSSAYPTTLGALVPTYLSQAALRAPETSVLQHPFQYRADSGRFELGLSYVGPGANYCRIHPGTSWTCSGFF